MSGSTSVYVAFARGMDEYAVAVVAADRADVGVLERALAAAAPASPPAVR